MPTAASSPTLLGLYINSFKPGSSTSPYKNLLGSTSANNGDYSGGNKLTDLYNYTAQYGYNYALFYDMDRATFTSNSNTEEFIPNTNNFGKRLLDTLMPQAHAAGLTTRSMVMDVYNPFTSLNTGSFNGYSGISDVVRVVDYNNYTSNDPTKIFEYVTLETEFWNFKYTTNALPGNVKLLNNPTTGEIRNDNTGTTVFTTLGLSVKDFVLVNNEWRQIVQISSSFILVDRKWNVPTTSAPWAVSIGSGDETVDYETYLWRVRRCILYIAQVGASLKMDLYVAFPKSQAGIKQLAKLYQAGVYRINLTNYALNATPRWSLIDAGTYGPGNSVYKRVSDDICSDGVPRNLGMILSMEKATNNNGPNPTRDTSFNFSGLFAEGKSITPHSISTDFKAVDITNAAITCVGCVTPIFDPPVTYNPLSLDEIWQYSAESPPTGGTCPACYPAKGSLTFNEVISGGGTVATLLDTNITFDTMVIFDQEFIRQLNITPAIALSLNISGTDVTCNGFTDGTATVSASGGIGPYTYLWDDLFTSTTSSINGLPPGTYTCIVTDSVANSDSISVTIGEPAIIGFDNTTTEADCAGNNGSIRIHTVVGGSGAYSYSVVPTGITPTVWVGNPLFTGLSAGTYDAYVASGDPSNSCWSTPLTFLIGSGSSFTISQAHTNVTCNGGNNGSITITPTPSGSYTYNLYDAFSTLVQSNTTGIFNNLSAKSYTVTGVNTTGCDSNTLSITITEPTIVSSTEEVTLSECYNSGDALVQMTASGGNSPYEYFLTYPGGIENSNSTGLFNNLVPGTYSYYVLDTNGCSSILYIFTVAQTPPITPIYTVVQIPEGETSGGSITLESITGGNTPYNYSWSNGANTASISNLTSGTYTVTINDNNDCDVSYTFHIRTECDNLSLDAFKVQIFKIQCCSGQLSKKYIKYIQAGREDLAQKTLEDLKILTLILDAVKCVENPGDEICFTCLDLINLFDQVKTICSCDCCEQADNQNYNVTFNENTNQLDIID